MFEIGGFSFSTLILSYYFVFALRRWTERGQIFDIPNERSSHTRPVPRGGGIAIVLLTLIGLSIYAWLNPDWAIFSIISYVSGALLISAVSWLDDLRSLNVGIRFSAHSLGAILAVIGFGYWHTIDFPFLGQIHLGWIGLPVTFLWIVGLTNAYNFMDGIDGIAGGQAVVAGLGWGVLGCLSNQPTIGILGLLLAGSSLGFLGHNWPPARIFMGDVGSAFLGYTLAVLPVIATQNDSHLALPGALLVWPFLFDTVFTFFCRLRNRENIFEAHRSHLYQRLVVIGYSHRFVSILFVGLALIGVFLSLLWVLGIDGSPFAVALGVPFLCISIYAFVNFQERRRIAVRQSPSST
jgi:UDP-N-acetylmuramyl pentapeptide phosphotransferase/UDP-N-acetylglucosamine-1-phosphate transferase